MEQIDLFRLATQTLDRLRIGYMVVGSFASSAYGEPRFTRDIDIVIDLTAKRLEELCASFPPEQFYVSAEAARAALRDRGQFNVIHPESGNKIDFIIARDDEWGREQLQRRRQIQLPPAGNWYAASPEDVVISKLLYFHEGGSDKHLRDIAAIFQVMGEQIDRVYIQRWAGVLGVADEWRLASQRILKTS